MSVSLCEDCFPPRAGLERLTCPPIAPCAACGRYDGRHLTGPVVRTYPSDPRQREEDRGKPA